MDKKQKYIAVIALSILAIGSVVAGGFFLGFLSLSGGVNFTIVVNPLQGTAPLTVSVSGNFGGYATLSVTLIVDNKDVSNSLTDTSGNYAFSYIFAVAGQHTVQVGHFGENNIGRPIEYYTSTVTVAVSGSSPTHNLNILSLGSGYTVPSGSTSYSVGQVVTITAFGTGNSYFNHWIEDGQVLTQTSSTLSITMDTDHSVSAVFTQRLTSQVYLTTSVSPIGSGSLNQSTASFAAGTVVSIQYFAGVNSVFNQWILDGSTAGGSNVIMLRWIEITVCKRYSLFRTLHQAAIFSRSTRQVQALCLNRTPHSQLEHS
jgi:hypothetical protein